MEAIRFAWRSPAHRLTLISNTVVGLLTFNFPTFYSSIVTLTFHAPGAMFGLAESLNAVTAVAGGLYFARHLRKPSLKTFAAASACLGCSMAWSAASPSLQVFLIGMPIFGAAVVFYQVSTQSLLQQNTPPEMMGRIMSLMVLGTMGTTPVGGVLTGLITDALSVRAAIGLGAAGPLACALLVAVFTSQRSAERRVQQAAIADS
jgi:MFS family permease